MRTLTFMICTFWLTQLLGQRPFIHANSFEVDIREGNRFVKGQWTILPEVKPDVYDLSGDNTLLTFITDLDSISFLMKIGDVINFDIIVNGKDTAWTQITCKPSYLDILKKGDKYNPEEVFDFPNFTYLTMDDPSLQSLRKGFNLDSIAGTGNDLSKVINLMYWVHNLIPHDGNNGNPEVKNALSMIHVCQKENRGMNCRGLATVLNECYLALGFKSRFVTCMPKDSVFQDCHVINMVWIDQLNKWIWIDPTNNAYVMDENGVLLSIEEVRYKLINNQKMLINPDANWNRKESVYKEYYLDQYMAKNLYRIQCPVDSKYDTETTINGKSFAYIELLPLDAYHQISKKSKNENNKTGMSFTYYNTNNPNVFWKRPE